MNEASLIAYKAFDENMQCRGFQYAEGETYVHKGEIEMCGAGFHACENPLDTLNYYPLIGSRFALVEYTGEVTRKDEGDSKVCGGSITIKAEVKFGDLIGRAVDYITGKAKPATSGNRSPAATSGHRSPAATSGDYSHAATSGNRSHAATSGYRSHAATSGDCSPAEAKGKNSAAAAIGRRARARAGKTGGIALAEYDSSGNLVAMFASLVGQNGIKPDTWYQLVNGKPVKVAP